MKEFLDQFDRLHTALRDPEYLFMVLEPLQFYGIGFAVLVLVAAWFLKSEKLQVTALALIIGAALSTLPYMDARKTAQKRMEHVYQVESPARVRGFAANTETRDEGQKFFFILAFLAGAAILVGPRRNRFGFGVTIVSAVVGLYVVHFSLWMHYQDSLAFHPHLKTNDAPVREKMRNQPDKAAPEESPASVPEKPPASPDASRIPAPQPPEAPARTVRPLNAPD